MLLRVEQRAEAERTAVAVSQSHQTRERCRKLRITLPYRAGHEEAETCGDASQLQLAYLIPNLQETCRSRRQSMLSLLSYYPPDLMHVSPDGPCHTQCFEWATGGISISLILLRRRSGSVILTL
jgi:hypothetical protein